MNVIDFEYDGVKLSDKGYIICNFNDASDVISNGSEITFVEVPLQHGIRHAVAGTKYDTVISTSFSICKDYCNNANGDDYISVAEVRELARWLNRKMYLPFRLLCDGYENITYFGSFYIEQIKHGTNIIGLRLTLTTNSPFGWADILSYKYTNVGSFSLGNLSDEIGYLYITLKAKCRSAGDLRILNSIDSSSTVVLNCSTNEEIEFSHPLISTTKSSHDLASDFNYEFPKIVCTYDRSVNNYTLSLPCDIDVSYRPLAKIGV